MKELQAWLERRAGRDQRFPCLDDVFLSGRFAPYAWFRLRLFFLRWFAATVVHLFRIVLLSAAFSGRDFVRLLLAEAAVAFLSSFWWGALESMRERVRDLRRQGRPFAVPHEIERWLTAAWLLAAVVSSVGAVWLATRGSFGPFELYAAALFVRLALQFVTRTFHSGAYAMRRIFRPGWAVVAVELLSFITVVIAWPALGAWALPIASLASSLAGSGITLYFTDRMYRFMGVRPRWAVPGSLRQPWKISWSGVAAAGLSFAVMKLDAVLVFGVFDRHGPSSELQLAILLFVMAPTIQAGFDWAYLFYFDLKRLHVGTLAPLLADFRRRMTRLACVLGVLFWVLGCATATVVYLGSLGSLYWLLGPFFIVRSLAACAQMQAFSVRRYGVLLGTSALWLAAFEIARHVDSDPAKLAILTLATASVYAALQWLARPASDAPQNLVGLVEWLWQLAAVPTEVRVGSATLRPLRPAKGPLAKRGAAWSQRQFARALARRLRSAGAVTLAPPDHILWFELARETEVGPASVAALSGGIAQIARASVTYPDGRAAAAGAWRDHGLAVLYGPLLLHDAERPHPPDLQREFARLFPDGWVFSPGGPAPAGPALPARWRRGVIHAARRFVDELDPVRGRSPFEVTALSVAGQLRLVFVARADSARARRRTWRTTITQANVQAALDAGRR